ncbi:Major Facilitator Superfamily protein [Parapedobacter luteus]|uniref:Major Facilitator Superfamily protein n=1 Tax=Parapedobacter luteus TaxID=623280 RepID=A0A1T5AGM9_9SPHI|nr:MFS transporter [Parapedobacter luteus]SKB33917.1 Major Facilitator Superfamily protein [Parapedobacter luteus]
MIKKTKSSIGVFERKPDMRLFYACVISLVATSFGFVLRAFVLNDWGKEFQLTQTQLGEISGVGLWPFAISIVLFSLIVDRLGYKTSMVFAFLFHVASAVVTIFATGYWMLYIGTFMMAIGNGIVEAVVNPVVATMFPQQKTKWLAILHAGWPGGLVLGGLMALAWGPETAWGFKISLILIPTLLYGGMMVSRKFAANERVQAGVSYLEMLRELGGIGALLITALIVFQLGQVFGWSPWVSPAVTVLISVGFGVYVKSWGRSLFIVLLLVMVPLAITELGTDSWISSLMEPEMERLGLQGGWVLVYTSAIMLVMRLFAGSLIHRMSPLGMLALSSCVAAIGMYYLSHSIGVSILIAATIYAFGKSYLWPLMLGVVSEQFPKGGALTLNVIAGLGMISAGVLGAGVLGFLQDKRADGNIVLHDAEHHTSLHSTYLTEKKTSLFGEYQALDFEKLEKAPQEDKDAIVAMQESAKKLALRDIVVFPVVMLAAYLLLILYFKQRGGYKIKMLDASIQTKNGSRKIEQDQ